ncbi:hypothetical protein NQ314_003767 [Rhamnusium bicolor]|uniref:PiggyBac transposable element-derived protein 4 C-terminal zinc-ribbon domain-containing protein n=1 Tax=Rhamnusium bicolor TaxID=1586634 RepID=A0AAV8ZN36_9CUCU|nr:hypothetical protein NQ314_003767 [Rhamnusium bicolor]
MFILIRINEILDKNDLERNPNPTETHGRCGYCSSKKNRKTRYRCHSCKCFLCLEHLKGVCEECASIVDE